VLRCCSFKMLDVNELPSSSDPNAWSSRYARFHNAAQNAPTSRVIDETRQTLVWNRLEALRLKELGLEQNRKYDLKRHVNRSPLYYGDQPAWTAGLPTLRQPSRFAGSSMTLASIFERSPTLQSQLSVELSTVSQVLREQTKRHLADDARMRALILSNNRVSPFVTLEQPDPESQLNRSQTLSPRKDFRKLRLDASGVIPCDVASWRSSAAISTK